MGCVIMQGLESIFYIVVLIMSVVIHEVAHGYAALYFGDKTAEYQGRLTFNPLKHLDLFGSVVLPLLLIITHAPFLIGWAKPVPYNPDNFTNRRRGTLWVAAAGILTNLFIALLCGLIIRAGTLTGLLSQTFIGLLSIIVLLNIVLAIFNLIPLPPLDGSKILFTLLGNSGRGLERFLERYALVTILLFIFFVWDFIAAAIYPVFFLFTGLPLS